MLMLANLDEAGLRERAATGDTLAQECLTEVFLELGRLQELEAEVNAGTEGARERLALLRQQQARTATGDGADTTSNASARKPT